MRPSWFQVLFNFSISLLIFCLAVLFTKTLQLLLNCLCLTLILLFHLFCILFIYFGTFKYDYDYNHRNFLIYWHFYHYKMLFFIWNSIFCLFVLKVEFVWHYNGHSSHRYYMIYNFIPFTFSLFISLDFKSVSNRGHFIGSLPLIELWYWYALIYICYFTLFSICLLLFLFLHSLFTAFFFINWMFLSVTF